MQLPASSNNLKRVSGQDKVIHSVVSLEMDQVQTLIWEVLEHKRAMVVLDKIMLV